MDDLLDGYHRYRRGIETKLAELATLAARQAPRTLWIGCSDSRVIPEHIIDADPGDLLVHRNVANIVPTAGEDDTVGAVIEFAVMILGVERIVVCGHTGCGGLAALTDRPDPHRAPQLAAWIDLASPAATVVAELGLPEADRPFATVKAHARIQRDHVLGYPCVQEAVADDRLEVVAAVYALETGDVLVWADDRQEWVSLADATA